MKKCPFCAETIQDDAIKCRFCQSILAGPGAAATLPEAARVQMEELLRQGHKIQAIKVVRTATGLDLAASKTFVESYDRGITRVCPHCHSEIPRGVTTCPRCGKADTTFGVRWVALTVALLLLLWFLSRVYRSAST